MIIEAYWDLDCSGWFFDINEIPVRLPYNLMEQIVGKDAPNKVKIVIEMTSEVDNKHTICYFKPIKKCSLTSPKPL